MSIFVNKWKVRPLTLKFLQKEQGSTKCLRYNKLGFKLLREDLKTRRFKEHTKKFWKTTY